MKTYCVYKHTFPNGKVYIGQTCQKPEKRFKVNGTGYKNCTCIYNAIKKYGWDNIKHEILFDNLSLEEANKLEVELIKKYNSTNHKYGYNLQSGGRNGTHSDETKKKMSQWQIGKKLSDETKNKISKARTGQKDSEETRRKKSETHKKMPVTKEVLEKLDRMRKMRNIDALRERMRTLNIGRKHTLEARRHMSEAHKLKNAKRVLCVETGEVFPSLSIAAKIMWLQRQNIGKVCNGLQKTSGNFHWKFV